ncbi:uncharacterized protein LOC128261029 isoform X2 [Drosophila gunungcola]|uniref:uncharacterized protein LOC128261029 isoform X2 n=1 Tax=Drosophila gunungcola TaxID=103775 RepID=UPI0022E4D677|nr:uncharacterized protein LOC128261029 isoform X2 [Drosophila gunungcola]
MLAFSGLSRQLPRSADTRIWDLGPGFTFGSNTFEAFRLDWLRTLAPHHRQGSRKRFGFAYWVNALAIRLHDSVIYYGIDEDVFFDVARSFGRDACVHSAKNQIGTAQPRQDDDDNDDEIDDDIDDGQRHWLGNGKLK